MQGSAPHPRSSARPPAPWRCRCLQYMEAFSAYISQRYAHKVAAGQGEDAEGLLDEEEEELQQGHQPHLESILHQARSLLPFINSAACPHVSKQSKAAQAATASWYAATCRKLKADCRKLKADAKRGPRRHPELAQRDSKRHPEVALAECWAAAEAVGRPHSAARHLAACSSGPAYRSSPAHMCLYCGTPPGLPFSPHPPCRAGQRSTRGRLRPGLSGPRRTPSSAATWCSGSASPAPTSRPSGHASSGERAGGRVGASKQASMQRPCCAGESAAQRGGRGRIWYWGSELLPQGRSQATAAALHHSPPLTARRSHAGCCTATSRLPTPRPAASTA